MAKKKEITIRSSAAEYLSYVASVGDKPLSVELRYEDENIWLTQRLMAELYGVDVRTVNDHIQKIYSDGELSQAATIRNFRIVQQEGARIHAETEWEKFRIIQDRLYQSDFDRFLLLEEESVKYGK